MIAPDAHLKVYVATRPIDFRNYAQPVIMWSWLATVATTYGFSTT
jgi:hypothetical protein